MQSSQSDDHVPVCLSVGYMPTNTVQLNYLFILMPSRQAYAKLEGQSNMSAFTTAASHVVGM